MVNIEKYSPGSMKVDGISHDRDLKIIGDSVIPEWWRKEDHRLGADDIEDVLSASPEFLVVGKGYAENMQVNDPLKLKLEKENIELIAQDTEEAVDTFNRLRREDKNVAGVFHLTC